MARDCRTPNRPLVTSCGDNDRPAPCGVVQCLPECAVAGEGPIHQRNAQIDYPRTGFDDINDCLGEFLRCCIRKAVVPCARSRLSEDRPQQERTARANCGCQRPSAPMQNAGDKSTGAVHAELLGLLQSAPTASGVPRIFSVARSGCVSATGPSMSPTIVSGTPDVVAKSPSRRTTCIGAGAVISAGKSRSRSDSTNPTLLFQVTMRERNSPSSTVIHSSFHGRRGLCCCVHVSMLSPIPTFIIFSLAAVLSNCNCS